MNKRFILRAQALDNASPDLFEFVGNTDPKNNPTQEQAAMMIFTVIKGAKHVFDDNGMRLAANNTHFVARVLCEQRDIAGRGAPIVCYGEYDLQCIDTLGNMVVTAITGFAKQIDRTIQPDHLELVCKYFDELKKKAVQRQRTRSLVTWIAAALAVLTTVIVLILLYGPVR
ncbi:MAG: hypothetical protein FWD57_06240 [Polyangiaceae bacterium]|nr:hypothetical protein [Polyangiaceae bacterium]